MPFNLSLAKLKNLSGLHYVIIGLLTVHVSWIVFHMNLVSKDLINPWKLGGYGMYTKPNNKARLRVYDIRDKTKRLSKKTYASKNFRDENLRYIFRCRKITEEAFLIFLRDNPHLANVDLRFLIRERKFTRSPVAVKWVPHSVAEIKWQQSDKLTYSGSVCGEEYSGEIEYRP